MWFYFKLSAVILKIKVKVKLMKGAGSERSVNWGIKSDLALGRDRVKRRHFLIKGVGLSSISDFFFNVPRAWTQSSNGYLLDRLIVSVFRSPNRSFASTPSLRECIIITGWWMVWHCAPCVLVGSKESCKVVFTERISTRQKAVIPTIRSN